jgi:hypothetical protein
MTLHTASKITGRNGTAGSDAPRPLSRPLSHHRPAKLKRAVLAISKNGRLAAGSLTVEANASGTFDIAAARLRVVQSGRFEPRCCSDDTEDAAAVAVSPGAAVGPMMRLGGNWARHRTSAQVRKAV